MTDAAHILPHSPATAHVPSRLANLRVATLGVLAALCSALSVWAMPLAAQDLETFDPDEAFEQSAPAPASGAIDADLAAPADPGPATSGPLPVDQPLPVAKPLEPADEDASRSRLDEEFAIYSEPPVEGAVPSAEAAGDATAPAPATAVATDNTFAQDDLIGAAEGVFGKGAKGLAKMIEDLLAKEGQPNGYIVGREAGGAFIVGARYGSGTLHHKVEGERKVYWTGPSIGFDAGANAGNTFVLVYNLWDSEDLFKRYPAGEGQAYFIGGLHASYVRRGDVVLIPIRMGAGLRLGVNAGYMKFSKKQRWLPF